MRKLRSSWIVLSLAVMAPLAVAADSHPSGWVGVWELKQQTDAGPVTLRLQVPAQGSPQLYGSAWETLVLRDASFQANNMVVNWQAQGVNLVFKGQRTGDRVRGTWELVHPQYKSSDSFSGKRLIDRPEWKPLGSLDGPIPLFLDLNALLIEHETELRDYWKSSFYPDYLPLLQDPPATMRLAATLVDPNFQRQSREFSSLMTDLVNRIETKFPGAQMPYHFVALPYGAKQPKPIFVAGKAFLIVNAAAILEAGQPDPAVDVPLKLLRTSFERFLFTVRLPSVDLFRLGMPLHLFSKLYPDSLHRALGVPASQLAELENKVAGAKKGVLSGEKLTPTEQQVLAYQFVRHLAVGRTAQQLLDLTTATINKEYKAFLGGDQG